MDINELQRFTGKDQEVILMYHSYCEPHRVWSCGLQAKIDGTKLECEGRGGTPEEAFSEAAKKFDRATFSGLPEMNPSLTYEANEDDAPTRMSASDEPF